MTEVASRVDDDERWAGFPRGASSMTARDNARLFLLPPDDDKARAVTTSGVASMEMGRPGGGGAPNPSCLIAPSLCLI